MRNPIWSRIAIFAAVAAALFVSSASAQERTKIPDDVAEFIGRRANCEDWVAKAKAHSQNVAELREAQVALNCDTSRDEAVLREKYQSNPDALAALNAKWMRVIQRLSVRLPANRAPTLPESKAQ